MEEAHKKILTQCDSYMMSYMMATKNPQNIHRKYFQFLGGLSLHLKPPNSMAIIENYFLAIWDTSHWIFLSNLDSRHLMTSPQTLFGQF